MEEKKPFGTRLEAFFAGKGFYVVLFLCISVIGVSVWSMLSGVAEKQFSDDISMSVAGLDSSVIAEEVIDSEPITKLPVLAAEPESEAEVMQAAPPAEQTVETVNIPMQDYYIWPVSGEIDSAYSMAALVWNPTMCDWRTHDGIDIVCELGQQVKAAAGGTVTEIYEDDLLGTTVILSHRNGLETLYSNLAAVPTVQVGDRPTAGQVIGAVGDTALGEAGQVCHLHFAMRLDGESADPTEYLP